MNYYDCDYDDDEPIPGRARIEEWEAAQNALMHAESRWRERIAACVDWALVLPVIACVIYLMVHIVKSVLELL